MNAAAHEDWTSRDLALTRNGDEAGAGEAFGRLWSLTRKATLRQLAGSGVVGEDAEDVCQEVYVRLWRLRSSLRAATAGEWYALVRKTASRALADRWKDKPKEARLETDEEIADEDVPYLDALLLASVCGRVFEAADELWLGKADGSDAKLAVAALRLTLLDGLGSEEVAEMLGFDAEAFEAWLREPALVLRAAFSGLCWPNGALAGHVLRPESPLGSREMDEALRGASSDAGLVWSADEARVVVWRVRHAMQTDGIVRASEGRLEATAVEDILSRVRRAYPFERIARVLCDALASSGQGGALASPGLWRRITMEYHARHELPHKHILERAQPPAAEARFRLNDKTLDNWLSEGRVYSQIAAALRKEGR